MSGVIRTFAARAANELTAFRYVFAAAISCDRSISFHLHRTVLERSLCFRDVVARIAFIPSNRQRNVVLRYSVYIAIAVFSNLGNIRQNLHRYRALTRRLPLRAPSKTRDAIDVFPDKKRKARKRC